MDLKAWFRGYDPTKRAAKKCAKPNDPVFALLFHVMDMRSGMHMQQYQMIVQPEHTTKNVWKNAVFVHRTYPNGGSVGNGVKVYTGMNDASIEASGLVGKGATVDDVKALLLTIMAPTNLITDDPKHPVSMNFVHFLVSIIPGSVEKDWLA